MCDRCSKNKSTNSICDYKLNLIAKLLEPMYQETKESEQIISNIGVDNLNESQEKLNILFNQLLTQVEGGIKLSCSWAGCP